MDFREFLESQWSSFRPGRQREFPFQHEPGYNRKATDYLDDDTLDPEIEAHTDFNFYHVTTNIQAVKSSGRLKSRQELGIVGLGGGSANEKPNMVSTTYDYGRAIEIYHQLRLVAEMCRGQVRASIAWDVTTDGLYDAWDADEVVGVLQDWLPKNVFQAVSDGEMELDPILDKYIRTPRSVYEFFQALETAVSAYELGSDSTYNLSNIGFTGNFDDMVKVDPRQVAIVQVVARKGASSQQVSLEKEIRFYPKDLKIIRYFQPA